MSFASEFKTFVMRGNVVDMAVGIVVGGAFGTVVKSLVSDIIMPPLGAITGGIDFSSMKVVIQAASGSQKEIAITYGAFVNAIIAFIIIAFSIFIVIKLLQKLMPKKDVAPAAPAPEVALLTEIRDLLKQPPH